MSPHHQFVFWHHRNPPNDPKTVNGSLSNENFPLASLVTLPTTVYSRDSFFSCEYPSKGWFQSNRNCGNSKLLFFNVFWADWIEFHLQQSPPLKYLGISCVFRMFQTSKSCCSRKCIFHSGKWNGPEIEFMETVTDITDFPFQNFTADEIVSLITGFGTLYWKLWSVWGKSENIWLFLFYKSNH
jgi:hypothetical protein